MSCDGHDADCLCRMRGGEEQRRRRVRHRRHHRERVIRRRLAIIKNVWRIDTDWPWFRARNRFHKHNLSCGCYLCKPHKHIKERKRYDWSKDL